MVVVVLVVEKSYSMRTVAMALATPRVRHAAGPNTLTSTTPDTLKVSCPVPTNARSAVGSVTVAVWALLAPSANVLATSGCSVSVVESWMVTVRSMPPGPIERAPESNATVVERATSVRLNTCASTVPASEAITVTELSVPAAASN